MGQLNESIKKLIKEEIENFYTVIGHTDIPEDYHEKYQSSLPTLDEFGVILVLSDSRRIHCVILDFGNGIRYGSATDGGTTTVFDLSTVKNNDYIFNRFKKEVETYFDSNLMDSKDCKSRFKKYIEKRFVNKT